MAAQLAQRAVCESEARGVKRRVVYQAQAQLLTNSRCVVTTRTDEAEAVYDWYVDPGGAEGCVKDYKLHCKADRLSCHRYWANQFRLILHACACWLLDTPSR